jgi:hypothetical protein
MKATITALGNERTKTYDIVKTWNDGTKTVYRTTELTYQEFEDMEYNTENDWKDFLKTSQDYYVVEEIYELTDEQVMNLVEYYEDSAYLRSKSVESNYNNTEENAEVFEKAIDVVDQELIGYEFIEVEYIGDGYRAIWHKIS